MSRPSSAPLLPRQRAWDGFPRFGLPWFAARWPDQAPILLQVTGELASPLELLADDLACLPRREQTSDLHCATTWTACDLHWGGVSFTDFYQQIVVPRAQPDADCRHTVLTGRDGYWTSLPLEDLLGSDVLLADQLDGRPLSAEHGAPLRLIAPRHYGYKNVKYLASIRLLRDPAPGLAGWKDHSRGRVALEERGLMGPVWTYRWLLRALLPAHECWFRRRSAATSPRGAVREPDALRLRQVR